MRYLHKVVKIFIYSFYALTPAKDHHVAFSLHQWYTYYSLNLAVVAFLTLIANKFV